MITKLGNVAIGSYVTVIRYGERYKIVKRTFVQNRIKITCKYLHNNICVDIHPTTNVWVNPKPKIKLKVKS